MTYNVFSGTLNTTQSINQPVCADLNCCTNLSLDWIRLAQPLSYCRRVVGIICPPFSFSAK